VRDVIATRVSARLRAIGGARTPRCPPRPCRGGHRESL